MVEVGKGGRRLEDHFVEATDMIEIGKGGRRLADHFVEVTDMVEIGKGDQRMELFGVQVPGERRSTAPNHNRAAPRQVRRNGTPARPSLSLPALPADATAAPP